MQHINNRSMGYFFPTHLPPHNHIPIGRLMQCTRKYLDDQMRARNGEDDFDPIVGALWKTNPGGGSSTGGMARQIQAHA